MICNLINSTGLHCNAIFVQMMVLARYPNLTPDKKMQYLQVGDVANPTSMFKYTDTR